MCSIPSCCCLFFLIIYQEKKKTPKGWNVRDKAMPDTLKSIYIKEKLAKRITDHTVVRIQMDIIY